MGGLRKTPPVSPPEDVLFKGESAYNSVQGRISITERFATIHRLSIATAIDLPGARPGIANLGPSCSC